MGKSRNPGNQGPTKQPKQPKSSSQPANTAAPNAWTAMSESNLLWGALPTGLGIVITTIAATMKDLRWLLWLALPFFMLSAWSASKFFSRSKLGIIVITFVLSLIVFGGLWWLNEYLKPEATIAEIGDFGNEIVVAIQADDGKFSNTGFWADRPHYLLVTCSEAVASETIQSSKRVTLALKYPVSQASDGSFQISNVFTAFGIAHLLGQVGQIAVLDTREDGGSLNFPATGQIFNKHFDYYASPVLSRILPKTDDDVFITGVEEGDGPIFSLRFGKVTSIISYSPSDKSKPPELRFHMTIPFNAGYCGAPVLNRSKQVVGMMLGSVTGGDSEAVSSEELLIQIETQKANKTK
jgi:hypothetical protein